MPTVKRVLLGCAVVVAAAGLVVAGAVVWLALPSGKPIPLFVVNAWPIPLEVRVGGSVLVVPAGSRAETSVRRGPVHLVCVDPATGRVLESLDVGAEAQSRMGRWSEDHVEKRTRLYVYNPGARAAVRITGYPYSTGSLPVWGGPEEEVIRGERWVLAERIKFVFTPPSATQEIFTSGRDSFATVTVRGIQAGPDDYEYGGDGPTSAAQRSLDEALRFYGDDAGLWRIQYDRSRRLGKDGAAAGARRELFRLNDRRLDADPCDQEAWREVEGLVRYGEYAYPEDGALAALKEAQEARLAARPACGGGETLPGAP